MFKHPLLGFIAIVALTFVAVAGGVQYLKATILSVQTLETK